LRSGKFEKHIYALLKRVTNFPSFYTELNISRAC